MLAWAVLVSAIVAAIAIPTFGIAVMVLVGIGLIIWALDALGDDK